MVSLPTYSEKLQVQTTVDTDPNYIIHTVSNSVIFFNVKLGGFPSIFLFLIKISKFLAPLGIRLISSFFVY